MLNKSSSLKIVVPIIFLFLLILSCAGGFSAYNLLGQRTIISQQETPGQTFWEAWGYMGDYYYGDLPSMEKITYEAIRQLLLLLNDPYTVFVEPAPRELELAQMRGTYGGVGVDLRFDMQGQVVLSPYPGSPAERAGIREGDLLLAVDRVLVSDMSLDEIQALLHGEVGAPVILTISRPPAPPFDIEVIREEILIPSVTWRLLDQDPHIGYIHIANFTERTADEVATALEELQNAGISALVLDLRDNYGGLIDPAVKTTSQFLREGVVLYEIRRNGEEAVFPVQGGGMAQDIPLAVLVNKGTASAAEIVAAALQDHGRAPLIGDSTYGKGSVQMIFELSNGASLHVTSAIWLTPNRNRIDQQGLTPDIVVAPETGTQQDVALERAIAFLRQAQTE